MFKKLFAPFMVSVAFVVFVLWLAGGFLMPYVLVDLPSLLIALVAPCVVNAVQFGWKKTRQAFNAPFALDSDRETLTAAKAFFSSLGRYLGGFTVFAVITGTILLLANIGGGQANQIGRNIAVALLSVFYGALGAILFVIPWLGAIDERLSEN